MTQLRYLAPFGFLVLLPLGAFLGGAWTFTAAVAIALGLAFLDFAFGKEGGAASASAMAVLRLIPGVYVLCQLGITAWVASLVAGGRAGPLETVGFALSSGLATGVFGLSAAHELVHSRQRPDRALGLLFLASVFYMHFRIAHIYGHHRRAATVGDPASARLGEGLYAFLRRSISGQFREAWHHEARRLRRAGRPASGPGNRMVGYLAVELAIIVAIGLVNLAALVFVLVNAAVAVVLLETFNYVAHYGLSRGAGDAAARLGPEHSWNSANRMNNSALFNMGHHSDHHRHGAHPYAELKPIIAAPELPGGYAAALLTALFPPLWRRVMDPRVAATRR